MENIIKNYIKKMIKDKKTKLSNKTALIGAGSPLDSIQIVNLCLKLEDLAETKGFNFDWSGETMSKSKSMFRSIENLSKEFLKQQKSK